MKYHQLYARLVSDFIGRKISSTDGLPADMISAAEKRLGFSLPVSLREYYGAIGNLDAISRAHNQIRSLQDLDIEDDHLVFGDENQNVVSWGIPRLSLSASDPIVWQRNNSPRVRWYSEEKTFTAFLRSMLKWYQEIGVLKSR